MSDPSIRLRQSGQRLPTGTVTFLFTDIEGSTKLAQEYPDRHWNGHAKSYLEHSLVRLSKIMALK